MNYIWKHYHIFSLIFSLMLFLLSLYSLQKYPYSINSIFYIFYFFFFGISPLFQFHKGITLWGGRPFTELEYFITTLIALILMLIYFAFYRFFSSSNDKTIKLEDRKEERKPKNIMLVLISGLSLFIFIHLSNYDFFAILIRGGDEINNPYENMNMSSYLILTKFIRPVPAAALLLFKVSNKKNIIIEIVLWLFMLLANSPLGLSRFAVAAFYLPILIVYSKKIQQKYNFSLVLIFSILVLFPFFNLFRHWGEADLKLTVDFDMFLSGHFDSFQMFMRVLTDNIITYGRQLLGVLLFFVPRSIWPNKPVGSGYYVAEHSNLWFDNVSMNYLGEGYINGGFIGMILFIIFAAYFNAKMDYKFWRTKSGYLFTVFYWIMLGMEFIILRGALMSFFPITVGYLCALYLVYKLSTITVKFYPNKTKRKVIDQNNQSI